MRIPCQANPFPLVRMPGEYGADAFPARWVWHPGLGAGQPAVLFFRLTWVQAQAETVCLHVSADQRYELWLDGRRLGRGPERGDPAHWFFESYGADLAPGRHLLAARVWWFPEDGAPMAQMTAQPGFLLYAEGPLASTLSTGSGAWEALLCDAYAGRRSGLDGYHVVGWQFTLDGARLPWGWEADPAEAGAWAPAVPREVPIGAGSSPYADSETAQRTPQHHLTPAALGAMMEEIRRVGTVRHVELLGPEQVPGQVLAEQHASELAAGWQALLGGGAALTLAPGTRLRVLVDLDDYYCAYPELVVSGGRGAELRVAWAESLFLGPDPHSPSPKGNRDVVEAKYFRGMEDCFRLEGGAHRRYDTLWWRAGRYVQLVVTVGAEALTLEQLAWRETSYPLTWQGAFEASDARLQQVAPVLQRTLRMCAHETYMDCPYYEQLMYVGDTRLEVLATYLTTNDSALPIKAIQLFDWSRAADGLTKSRYPSAVPQVIPGFSLWWVAMVHDFAMWRDRPDLVRAWLPGVDAVLAGIGRFCGENGLVTALDGWVFADWVSAWKSGWPPAALGGASAIMNLQYLYALRRAQQLHDQMGEPHLAAHWAGRATALAEAIYAAYWDEARGLLADDPAHSAYSEHAQALALLTDLLEGAPRQRLIDGLLSAPDLQRTTVYFSHYLLEALYAIGRGDLILSRLAFWLGLPEMGLKTVLEKPEPSRSDCHAWGAHPLYHYYASLLGLRPATTGLRSVVIRPQPGGLAWLRGALPDGRGGEITFDLRFAAGSIGGAIALPEGLTGVLEYAGRQFALQPGSNAIG